MELITVGISSDIPIYVHLKETANAITLLSFRVQDILFARWGSSLRHVTVWDMKFKTPYGVFILWDPSVRYLYVEMLRKRIFIRTPEMTEKTEIISHWFTHV